MKQVLYEQNQTTGSQSNHNLPNRNTPDQKPASKIINDDPGLGFLPSIQRRAKPAPPPEGSLSPTGEVRAYTLQAMSLVKTRFRTELFQFRDSVAFNIPLQGLWSF